MNGRTLEELQADLTGLKSARASGALSVRYLAQGVLREVTYRRDADLQAAIAALQAEIDALTFEGRPMNVVVRGRRGWAPERSSGGAYGREHAEQWRGHSHRGRGEFAD